MELMKKIEEMGPYQDDQVEAAVRRILYTDHFKEIIKYLYKDQSLDEVIKKFEQVKTVNEFQTLLASHAVREILKHTSDGFTFSGTEALSPDSSYLFIANHRDIVLDSAIMEVALVDSGHETSQITFGSNLMSSDFLVDLGKLNKMFTFYRGGTKLQMYKNALLHSEYIRYTITKKRESVWIAQRDGRTKDGDDKTQSALIKMLAMGRKDFLPTLKELNIVPVSISYEYEPCDAAKVQERYISKREVYKKQPGEDLNSILHGIKEYKGYVHLAFGAPLNNTLEELTNIDVPVNDLIDMVVDELDNQIHKNFALWPGNYVAYDFFKKTSKYSESKYTQEQKVKFFDYVKSKVDSLKGDNNELMKMFVKMYAMPVINKRKTDKYSEEEVS